MSPRVWIPERCSSPLSSESSFDEDEVNFRVKPYWPNFFTILKRRGFRLDTVRDVKAHYTLIGAPQKAEWMIGLDDDSLCPDPGLVSFLYDEKIPVANNIPRFISPTTFFEAAEP